ncbi:MAG: hypothetical protein HQL08_08705 [Nitrospirae bacterium]|nr:hypothetical protein [Nitrospirota bacterium]
MLTRRKWHGDSVGCMRYLLITAKPPLGEDTLRNVPLKKTAVCMCV